MTEDGSQNLKNLTVSGNGTLTVTLTLTENGKTPADSPLSGGQYANVVVTSNGNSITLKGSANDINEALKTVNYKPTVNFNGNVVLAITVSGIDGNSNKDVNLQVTSVNDSPVLTPPSSATADGAVSVNEGKGNSVTLTPGNFGIDLNNIQAFDPDLDKNLSTSNPQTYKQLVFEVTSASLAHGNLYKGGTPLLQGSSFTLQDLIDNKITYVHNGDQARNALNPGSEADHFNVTVRDGAGGEDRGSIHIKINPVNDAPTISADTGGVIAYEGRNGVPVHVTITDKDQASNQWSIKFNDLALQGGQLYLDDGAGGKTAITEGFIFTGTLSELNAQLRLDISADEPDKPISFKINATDDGGGTTTAKTVTTTIEIAPRENNDHPDLIINAGSDAPVTPDTTNTKDNDYTITLTDKLLGLVDLDSPPDTITFTLESDVMKDSGGGTAYIVLNNKALGKGSTFTYKDVLSDNVKLLYKGGGASNFHFDFSVRDGEITAFSTVKQTEERIDGGTRNDADTAYLSHRFNFGFDAPLGDEGDYTPDAGNQPPELGQINGITDNLLSEDGSVTLWGGDKVKNEGFPGIEIIDHDNTPEQITLRLEKLPPGGSIWLGGKQLSLFDSFTYAQLIAGEVEYRHNGGERFTAESLGFAFSISDGSANVTPTVDEHGNNFNVTAKPVNDGPEIAINDDVLLAEGGSIVFNNPSDPKSPQLSFSDVDGSGDKNPNHDNFESSRDNPSDDLYVTVGTLPQHGDLIYKGIKVDNTTKILRSDIEKGLLKYAHHGNEEFKDSFTLTVNDNQGQANSAGKPLTVNIKIAPINDSPSIDKTTGENDRPDNTWNTGLRVPEGGSGVIGGTPALGGGSAGSAFGTSVDGQGNAVLVAYDPDNDPDTIQYRITENVKHGKLMLGDQVLTVGSTFTQAQLDAGLIKYVHIDGNGEGFGVVSDSFKFQVGDGGPGEYPEGQFDIEIWTQTNDAPTVKADQPQVDIDKTGPVDIPGLSIDDVDFPTGDGQIQVVVRLTDANGNPLAVDQYAGYTISSAAKDTGVTLTGGRNGALTLSGSVKQINDYLAKLQFQSATDPNTTLKLEIIADDRVYVVGKPTSDANGGDKNQSQTEGGDPLIIDGKVFDPYETKVSEFGGYNVASSFVTLRISPVDQDAGVTVPGDQTALEDVKHVIKDIQVHDPEAEGFGLDTTVTLNVNSGTITVGSQDGVTVTGSGGKTITLTGKVADINALLAKGVTYLSAANSHSDTNGAELGDATLTVSIKEGSAAIGGGGTSGDDTVTQKIAIFITPVNDGPTAGNAGSQPIPITNASDPQDIGGFTVGDKDSLTTDETDFIQVTVRLVGNDGKTLSKADYAKLVFSLKGVFAEDAGFEIDDTLNGQGQVLQMRGNLDRVNAALAALQLTLGADLGNRDNPYKVQIIADDRLRDVKTGALSGGANGGTQNNDNGAASAGNVDAAWDLAPYADQDLSRFNIATAERIIWPSSNNEPPEIARVPSNVPVPEDERTFIGPGFTVTDAESNNFGLPIQVTLDVGPDGKLSIGGDTKLTDGDMIGNSGVKVVSGDETGKLVLEGTAAAITALLNDASNGLFYTSNTDDNADHNGADTGDVTVKMEVNEHESATHFGLKPTVIEREFFITVTPVNDAPVVNPGGAIVFLPSILEDHVHPGTGSDTVGSIFGKYFNDSKDQVGGSGTNTDDFFGVAIVSNGATADQGQWQYFDGSAWVNIPTDLGDGKALILGKDVALQFIPAADWHGTPGQLSARLVEIDVNGDTTSTSTIPESGQTVSITGSGGFGGTSIYSADKVTLGITVTSVNDAPVATPDTNTMTENDSSVSGGLIQQPSGSGQGQTGPDSDKDSALDSSETIKVTEVSLKNGGSGTVDDSGIITVAGKYGTLTVNPNGSYTYQLNTNDPEVNALVAGGKLTEVFDYTITDKGGLSDASTLTITITGDNDGGASIVPKDHNGADIGGQITVKESGLAQGSNPGKDATAAGSIDFTAGNGLGSINIGGEDFSLEQLQAIDPQDPSTHLKVDLVYGVIVITGFKPDASYEKPVSGRIDYSFTLTKAQSNAVPGSGDAVSKDIALKVTEAGGISIGGTLTVQIIDDTPAASADTASVTEGANVTVDAADGVLKNDKSGADGWWKPGGGVVGVSPGTGGTPSSGVGTEIQGTYGKLTLNADGSYSYAVTANSITGDQQDVFTYTVRDADGDETTATLTITVKDVSLVSTPVGGTVNESGLTGGSTAGNGHNLVKADLDLPPGQTAVPDSGNAAYGSFEIHADGSYSYTLTKKSDGATVSDSFTYTSTDGNGNKVTNTVTITIVDDVPTANDNELSLTTGQASGVGNALTDGTPDTAGADGGLEVTDILAGNKTGTLNDDGSWTVQGEYGTLTIYPNGEYNYARDSDTPLPEGTEDVFSYGIKDADGDKDRAAITIHLADKAPILTVGGNPVPDGGSITPPQGGVNESGLPEGSQPDSGRDKTSGSITLTPGDGNTTVTITPENGGNSITLNPGDSKVVITPNGEFTVTYEPGDPGAGTPPTISYEYVLKTPSKGDNTTDPFKVKVTDSDGDTTSVTVDVKIFDDVPEAVADKATVDNGTNTATGNALDNDTLGADRDTTVTDISSVNVPANGMTSNLDGSFTIKGEHGTLTIKPDGSYVYERSGTGPLNATDVFEYVIADKDVDTDPAKITITIADKGPSLNPPSGSGVTPGNPSVGESGLPDGSSPDSGNNKTTGKLEIDTPDGVSTITVTPPGGGTPVTLDPGKGITSGTVDTPNGKVTVTYDPGNGTDKPSITWEYELTTPADNSDGKKPTDSFTITVTDTDGDITPPSTITIDIVDDTPDAQDDSNSTLVNVPITGELGGNDKPGADGPLTWSPSEQPSHGTVTIDPDTGKYTYTPEPGFVGTDTFTYTVTDKDGSTSTVTVTITVTNQPPVAVDDSNVSEPGKPATGNVLTGGSSGDHADSDPDGQPVTVTEVTVDGITVKIPSNESVTIELPNKGTLVIGSDGSYTFTPVPLWGGQVPDISYTISDGAGGTDTATLRITVTAIPSAPDVPARPPIEIPTFSNQGERPLYDMRGQTPWSGSQFYFPSVFWENPGFGTRSLFPQPFHPVVYVNDEVVRSQTLHQTYAIDSQWANWFDNSNVLLSTSTYLGMDHSLFVQHAVRFVQWHSRMMEFLARSMQTNLPTESPELELPNANLNALPESLNDTVAPPPQAQQPAEAAVPETSSPAGDVISELQEHWNTAELQPEATGMMHSVVAGKSSSFSEQLKQSSHQLPSHIG